MDLGFVTDYLDGFINLERDPSAREMNLDTMNSLCDFFDHPEKSYDSIHVAGSKGKGSITTMVGSIANEYGKKVGLYRSPHVRHFSERISDASGPFSEEIYQSAFLKFREGIKKYLEKNPATDLTWYELVTMYGFLVFKEAGCDFVVFEVGMGGRLDATNVIDPVCSIISTIELEHTKILGSTLAEIAKEKGGIIKKGRPVIVCAQNETSVLDVFRKIARERQAGAVYFLQDYKPEINYYLNDELKMQMEVEPDMLNLSLLGDFQAMNAKAAEMATRIAFSNISDEMIKKGLKSAFLPGRFEILTSRDFVRFDQIPYLILDGAHTEGSVSGSVKLLETYRNLLAKEKTFDSCLTDFTLGEKPILLFGCAEDKNVEKMAKELIPHFSKVFLTRPGDFKHSELANIKAAFSGCNAEIIADPDYKKTIKTALNEAEKTSRGVVSIGSLYLVGEVKKVLEELSDMPTEWV